MLESISIDNTNLHNTSVTIDYYQLSWSNFDTLNKFATESLIDSKLCKKQQKNLIREK